MGINAPFPYTTARVGKTIQRDFIIHSLLFVCLQIILCLKVYGTKNYYQTSFFRADKPSSEADTHAQIRCGTIAIFTLAPASVPTAALILYLTYCK